MFMPTYPSFEDLKLRQVQETEQIKKDAKHNIYLQYRSDYNTDVAYAATNTSDGKKSVPLKEELKMLFYQRIPHQDKGSGLNGLEHYEDLIKNHVFWFMRHINGVVCGAMIVKKSVKCKLVTHP